MCVAHAHLHKIYEGHHKGIVSTITLVVTYTSSNDGSNKCKTYFS